MTIPELVQLAAEGDVDALERLLRRFDDWIERRVRGSASSALLHFAGAEDVAQWVRLRAFRSIRDFQARDDPAADFERWLGTLVLREVQDAGRRRQRALLEAATKLLDGLEDASPSPSREVHARDVVRRVQSALAELPEDQGSALAAQGAGQAVQDIARRMGRTEVAVNALLWRGRETLKVKLRGLANDSSAS